MNEHLAVGRGPTRFRPYPAYKDSGVESLGKIPEHWTIAPLYGRYDIALGKMLDASRISGEHLRPYLRNVDVQWDRINLRDLPEMDFDTADRIRYSLRSGDLLVCEGGEVGRTAVWTGELQECYYQKALHRLRPYAGSDTPRFFYYVMQASSKAGRFTAGTNPNTIDHLTAVQLSRYRFAFPSTDEQRAIVDFLDQETAKIDALVAKKERLIELLQEKRTALITQAVAKGLDPTIPMKDTDLEWLREIPTRWDVKRLKYLVPDLTVGIVVTPAKYYVDDGIPCLRSLNISSGEVDMENLVFMSKEANEYHRKSQIFEGDVVVVRTGRAGTAAIVPKQLSGANCIDLLIVRRSNQIRSKMVYYYLNSHAAISQAEVRSVGAIQGHYNTSTLAELFVPVIPVDEQDSIVRHLDTQIAATDALSTAIRDGIDRLAEFRTSLISAAVTGKIDVREEAT
jgi:type I restriction enzyme S subunit